MGHHILCIDDDKDFLFTLKTCLKSKYQVSIASGINEAVQILSQDPVDLVLLDVNLGEEKSGIADIPQIKKIDPAVVIVMFSGYKDPKLIVDSIKMGASDYLYKPYSYEELLCVIETNLSKKHTADRNETLVEHFNEAAKGVQIIGNSPEMQDLLEKAQKVKGHDTSLLIEGESGTGKEVFARYLHSLEKTPKRPFIAVNVAAIPDGLIESELFGHEKGAFTGADKRKIGKFEIANGGDLFLDEVNCLSKDFQAKLLRVLQEKEFFRVGGNELVRVNVRIISASNKDLYEEVARGSFREDLFYRLRVLNFTIAPLRERIEDIKPLIDHFMSKYSQNRHKKFIHPDILKKLQLYKWPGNVRELENVIQSLIIMSTQDEIGLADLPDYFHKTHLVPHDLGSPDNKNALTYVRTDQSLKEFRDEWEKYFIYKALEQNGGNFAKAARTLKISRTTLYERMHAEGLDEWR